MRLFLHFLLTNIGYCCTLVSAFEDGLLHFTSSENVVTLGERVTFTCTIQSRSSHFEIYIFKESIGSGEKIHVATNGILAEHYESSGIYQAEQINTTMNYEFLVIFIITHARHEDTGNYICFDGRGSRTKATAKLFVEPSFHFRSSKPGENVSLTCNLHGRSSESEIEIFKTIFADDENLKVRIGTINTLAQHYNNSGRYHITSVTAGQDQLVLQINSTRYEDSGNYIFIDKRTGKISAITNLYVYKKTDQSKIYFVNHSKTEPYVFVEDKPQTVQCFVNDVIPVPNVGIFIEDIDFTEYFKKSHKLIENCTSDSERCFNSYNVTVTSENILLDYTAHGKYIICNSTIIPATTNIEPVIAKVLIKMEYSPKFLCQKQYKVALMEKYILRCNVTSNPLPTNVAWEFVISGKKSVLETGTSMPNFKAQEKKVGKDMMQYMLVINEVKREHITDYSLCARNYLANNCYTISLKGRSAGRSESKSAVMLPSFKATLGSLLIILFIFFLGQPTSVWLG